MNNQEWQELYNDNADIEEYDRNRQNVKVVVNNYVFYECAVDIYTSELGIRDIQVEKMTRLVCDYDGDGSILHELDLEPHEFPIYIKEAAEKKAIGAV